MSHQLALVEPSMAALLIRGSGFFNMRLSDKSSARVLELVII
ncbi:MAG: hypothetical protein QOF02_763 [Blastocatellia bacterium]|jgi:hypothetical protein|nr:hypothetical protein [Blastocatellia bacterium]